jgi:hypothetical protein
MWVDRDLFSHFAGTGTEDLNTYFTKKSLFINYDTATIFKTLPSLLIVSYLYGILYQNRYQVE